MTTLQQVHRDLARELRDDPKIYTRVRQGVITAVDPATFTCTVALGGDTTNLVIGVPFIRDGYLLGINDTVWLLQTGTDLVVLGGHLSLSGTVTWLTGTTDSGTTTATGGTETMDSASFITAPVIQGLMYSVVIDARVDVSASGIAWAQRLRMSTISGSPSNPTTASTQIGGSTGFNSQSGGGGEMPCHGVGQFVASATGSTIVGASIARIAGAAGDVLLRAFETNTPITINAYCLGIP